MNAPTAARRKRCAGIIALLAASIVIVSIPFVSVQELTREIGRVPRWPAARAANAALGAWVSNGKV